MDSDTCIRGTRNPLYKTKWSKGEDLSTILKVMRNYILVGDVILIINGNTANTVIIIVSEVFGGNYVSFQCLMCHFLDYSLVRFSYTRQDV